MTSCAPPVGGSGWIGISDRHIGACPWEVLTSTVQLLGWRFRKANSRALPHMCALASRLGSGDCTPPWCRGHFDVAVPVGADLVHQEFEQDVPVGGFVARRVDGAGAKGWVVDRDACSGEVCDIAP